MAVVDASIPLAAKSQPVDMGRVLSLADMAMQMRQNQQNMRAQNALRTILAQPGSVDPKTGAPTPNALAQIMRVSPIAGMQLQRNALALQREQTQAEVAKTDLFAKKLSMSHDVGNEALSVYEQALSKGVPDQQARSLAQTTYTDGIKRMSSSGLFSQQDLSQINPTFDPARARANAMTYKDWMARKDDEAKLTEQHRHDVVQEGISQRKADIEAGNDLARDYSNPVEVMADDGKRGKVQILAQQNKKTGEWVTADAEHTPVKVQAIAGKEIPDENDPTVKNTADLIAGYQYPPLSSFAMRSPWGHAVMSAVKKLNPNYSATRYNEINRAMTAFGSGPQGNVTRSMNVGIQHLGVIDDLGKALENGDVQALNKIKNAFKEEFGEPAPTTFDAAKNIVADEIVKAIVGYSGAYQDRERAQAALNRANSWDQLRSVTKTVRSLMAGQLKGLKKQYEDATGFKNGPYSYDEKLLPETRKELEQLESGKTADAGDKFVEGRVYIDAHGNKARYEKGKWVEVK